MLGKTAQIGTEYLIVTAFILAIVTVVFGFSYVNNDQNMKANQANTALDTLVNKIDYVYARGPGNVQFAEVTLPQGIQSIGVVNLCDDDPTNTTLDCSDGTENPSYGSEAACDCGSNSGIKLSAVRLTISFFGGTTRIMRGSKTPIRIETLPEFPCTTNPSICSGRYKIKVYWNSDDSFVTIERV